MSSRSETSPEVVPISTVSTEIYVVLHSVQSQTALPTAARSSERELPWSFLQRLTSLRQGIPDPELLQKPRTNRKQLFDIEGSSGYRIEDGYLPQLKNVSGEILADQTPRELPDENLKVRRAEIYQQSSGVYNVEVYAENGGNGFLLDRIEADGLDFSSSDPKKAIDGLGIQYSDVQPTKFQSVYPAFAVFKKDGVEKRLAIQILVREPSSRGRSAMRKSGMLR